MTEEQNKQSHFLFRGIELLDWSLGACYKENCTILELEDTHGHRGICRSFQEPTYSQCGVHQTKISLVLSTVFFYNADYFSSLPFWQNWRSC